MAGSVGGEVRIYLDGKLLEGCVALDVCFKQSPDGETWEQMTPWVPMGDYRSAAICFTMSVPRSMWARVVAWGRKELANLWRMLKR